MIKKDSLLDLPMLEIVPPALSLGSGGLNLKPRSLFGEPDEVAELADPVDKANAILDDYKSTFQQRAKTEQDRYTLATDSAYWVCLCFETREQKEEFLRKTELDQLGDKHIDGIVASELLGVHLESPRPTWPKPKSTTTLVEFARKKD